MATEESIGRLQAIVAEGKAVRERELRVPRVRPAEIAIRVGSVGICRTDLYVIDGAIPANYPLIPGHEFAGEVVEVGAETKRLRPGDRVAVNPILPCAECRFCVSGCASDCQRTSMLGVDRDGACSSIVVVPESAAFPIPATLTYDEAAFAEPVAASLAVLKTGIRPADSGLIVGANRIARLTEQILRAHGFRDLKVCRPKELSDLPECHFDFAIETLATTDVLREMIRVIRPRGRIVLKSRQFSPIELTLRDLLPKEPVLEAVNYGPFEEAVALLAERRIDVRRLIGKRFPFSRFEDAMREARSSDERKVFLVPDEAM